MAKVKLKNLELAPVAIEYLRDIKGWTYRDIARKLKCDHSTVFRAHTQGTNLMRHTAGALQRLAKRVWTAEEKKNKR